MHRSVSSHAIHSPHHAARLSPHSSHHRRIAAAAIALACSADAFSFAPLPLAPSSRTLSASSLRTLGPSSGLACPERGGRRSARGLRMQEVDYGEEEGEGLNREQRRQAKRNKAKAGTSQERPAITQIRESSLIFSRIMSHAIVAHQYGKPGLFSAPKLTDFYHTPRMST